MAGRETSAGWGLTKSKRLLGKACTDWRSLQVECSRKLSMDVGMSILLLLSVYSVVVYKGIRKAFSVCRYA